MEKNIVECKYMSITFPRKRTNIIVFMYFWNILFHNKILRKYIPKYFDNDFMLFCEH